MPNGALTVAHNFTGETGYIIAQLVKSTAPLTEVAPRIVYPAPHSQQSILYENLQPVWHLVRFWRSVDGVALDEEILTLAGNARSGAVYPVQRFEYIVGRGEGEVDVWADPEANDIGIRDTRLAGGYYWVEERGTGTLLTSEIVDRTDEGGGFDFTQDGKVMNEEGVYIVTLITRADASSSGGSGTVNSEGVYILDEDQDYNSALMSGKLLIADFDTTVGTLTIPNLLLVPNGEFTLQTHGGLQRNVVIQLDAGDTVRFRGQDVNKITLGQAESIKIIFDENEMYVGPAETNHFRLGQRIWADMELLNTLICDGALKVLAEYPRAAELMDALPVGAVVNETTWQTSAVVDGITTYPNKGKWMREGTGFRPPDMRDKYVKGLAVTDGSQIGGRYGHQSMMEHYHFIASGGDGAGNYLSQNHASGGNSSYDFNASPTPPVDFRTSSAGSGNQEVNNIGQYPLICI